MPRGVDSSGDPRRLPPKPSWATEREPMPSWLLEGLKPGDAGSALPSVAGLLSSMQQAKAEDPIVEGMERRAWRDLDEPD